jgi:oxaloacetate decarboxylase alpha subunit/pyruvate carboxylase subunit B
MATVVLNNTVLRDGHQSLAATRMTTAQMLPAAGPLDALGFGALETWGGATIDAALRFLHEHPFERLSRLKAAAPRTPQMMLLRGQNLVQYTSFPDDVVEAFVACAAGRGLDLFRVFDALNDTRNLRTAIRAVKAAGRHAQGVICYTTSPVHTAASFVAIADELVGLGVDSLCLKDMAGLLTPSAAHELVSALRRRHACPLVVHSHDTAGLAVASYLAAVEAGADAIETSIAPFANGTGQPDTVRMLAALSGLPRAPSLDSDLLLTLRRHFEQVATELAAFMSPANERVDCDALTFQVPGGMLSNFRTQLAELHLDHRFHEVMREVPVVRAALGWIPLVTPTSQIVGAQAVLNVKFGRWRNLAPATAEVALGRFGRPPGPVDPELLALARRQAGREPWVGRPADELAPRMPALRAALAAQGFEPSDELAVLWAMFPRETEALLRPAAPPAPPSSAPAPAPSPVVRAAPPTPPSAAAVPIPSAVRHLRVTVAGRVYEVQVEPAAEAASLPAASAPVAPASRGTSAPAPVRRGEPVPSPLAGRLVSLDVAVGAAVTEGTQLATIEALKMNTFLFSPRAGRVAELRARPGEDVEEGTVLLILE